MEGRRDARERALELLYEADAKQATVADVLAALPVAPDPYATSLVRGVAEHRDAIDDVIKRHLKQGWTLPRMPVIDVAVLRLATFELSHEPDVPLGVVINEAVALAKEFSTDEAGRFVNGVLSAVAREVRPGG